MRRQVERLAMVISIDKLKALRMDEKVRVEWEAEKVNGEEIPPALEVEMRRP